jgi:glycerol dehydrogenase
VIGLGGGRSIDGAKGVSARRGLPLITVPTAASNDAPTSRIFVVYNDDGSLARVERLRNNPHAVIVDTSILLRAPVRLLRAGIGDALSKKFEAEQCAAVGGVTSLGTQPLALPAAIADFGYATLRAHAAAALADVAAGRPSTSLERVIEAVILMSGLGFENGGLSLAHSLTRGFTRAPGPSRMLHGEQVAFGLLVQLSLMRDAEPALLDLLTLYGQIGLPRTLADIGLSAANDAELAKVAAATFTAPHIRHLVDPINEAQLKAAFLRVDALARKAGG